MRTFESCLKSLPQGCADCVLTDDCAEKQLYEKGRADGIDECVNELCNGKHLLSTDGYNRAVIKTIAMRLKEQKDGRI